MASIVVSFPSETLVLGQALARKPDAVAYLYTPTVKDRLTINMRLENAKPLVPLILAGFEDRYDADWGGDWDGDSWVGWAELGMENLREFVIFDLVWSQEGLVDGIFLKFQGTTAIMRFDSKQSVEELQPLVARYREALPAECKVNAVTLEPRPATWLDLIEKDEKWVKARHA
ncbi:MAG: hypothetical protein ACPHK8_04670 [Thermoplasmatota archaeon]